MNELINLTRKKLKLIIVWCQIYYYCYYNFEFSPMDDANELMN